MGKKNILVALLAVAVIGAGLVWFFSQNTENMEQENNNFYSSDSENNNSNNGNDGNDNTEVASSDTHTNPSNPKVTFSTSEGSIVLEIFEDKMPITSENFLKLSEQGFYNGTKFHRVIEGFMIQGGDPNSKSDNIDTYGTGGPDYTIQDEFVEGMYNYKGTISMANTGQPNSGGSQFFINLVDNNFLDFNKEPLQSKHPVFGRVVGGMDIVESIGKTETGVSDIPITPVIIHEVIIER